MARSVAGYEPPSIVQTLILASFIYFLNIIGEIFDGLLHTGLIGHIILGMVYGPPLANILPISWLDAFRALGYLGLILIVFEGQEIVVGVARFAQPYL